MFKVKFLWEPIRQLYIPLLRAMGYKCKCVFNPYFLVVWATGNGLHEDMVFSVHWRKSFSEDLSTETHVFGVGIFVETKRYKVSVNNRKKLLSEIIPHLDRALVKLFVNAVAERAPDSWFTVPNQPTTLYRRHEDFPITVTAHHRPDGTPYLVLTGKGTSFFQPTVKVTSENAKQIIDFLTREGNISKSFWTISSVEPQKH
jgi:hypothetical protein